MTNQPDVLVPDAGFVLRKYRTLFLVEGVVLLLLGLAAIVVPTVATLAVEILVGWILLISGVVGAMTTISMRRAPGFTWSLVSAIAGIVAGLALLLWPLSGTVSLTLILVLFFIMEGFATILFALDHRRDQSARWIWMMLSGVIDLVLAAMIFAGLPGSSTWAIGLVVGINMIFGGSALLAMTVQAKGIGGRSARP